MSSPSDDGQCTDSEKEEGLIENGYIFSVIFANFI